MKNTFFKPTNEPTLHESLEQTFDRMTKDWNDFVEFLNDITK